MPTNLSLRKRHAASQSKDVIERTNSLYQTKFRVEKVLFI